MNRVITLSILALFLLSTIAFVSAQYGASANAGVNAEVKSDIEAARADGTINETERAAIKAKIRAAVGEIKIEGRNITVRELSDERKEIIAGKINARTGLNLTAEDIDNKTLLRAYLSNGRYAYVKHMPDSASAKALAVLRAKCAERNCTVELKEVGSGNQTRLAYEVSTDKDSDVLLIFKNKMIVRAQVDAETGEVISIKKPWWAFLAREKHSTNAEIEADTGAVVEASS